MSGCGAEAEHRPDPAVRRAPSPATASGPLACASSTAATRIDGTGVPSLSRTVASGRSCAVATKAAGGSGSPSGPKAISRPSSILQRDLAQRDVRPRARRGRRDRGSGGRSCRTTGPSVRAPEPAAGPAAGCGRGWQDPARAASAAWRIPLLVPLPAPTAYGRERRPPRYRPMLKVWLSPPCRGRNGARPAPAPPAMTWSVRRPSSRWCEP